MIDLPASKTTDEDRLAKLEAILNTAVAAIITIDEAGLIESVNPATTAMFGYSADEVVGQNIKFLMPEPYASAHDGYLANYLTSGVKKIIGIGREVIGRRKNGSTFPMHLAVSEFQAPGGRHFAGIATDLSERRAAQDALASSQLRFDTVFNSSSLGMVQLDRTGRFIRTNRCYQEMVGYSAEELLSLTALDITHPDDLPRNRAEVESLLSDQVQSLGIEKRYIRKDSSIIWVHISVSPMLDPSDGDVATFGVVIDITDRKRAELALEESERRLAQAQRLEAVGQLAGGIAHDFNNLLTVVLGNLELMEPKLESEQLRTTLKRIQDAATSGADLTRRLLGFSRQLPLEPQVVAVNELALHTCELLRRTLGEHINLATVLAPGVWEVRTDPAQIESALTNLALNARDAMPNGGRIVVETRNVTLDAGKAAAGFDLEPGDYVAISVSDTGLGIPPEIRDRVFEPFFTTKPKGRGTGLGLAMIYGFAKQSGGHVTLYSEVGHGTVVTLYLPRAATDAAQREARRASSSDSETEGVLVLLVEDDAAVRELNLERLKQLGHEVVEAATGAQALELIKGGMRPDLVFTDMVMPGGVSGRDLLEQVTAIDPSIRFLLTSGYSEAFIEGSDRSTLPLILQKPYGLAELAAALKRVLTSRR